MKEKQKNKIRNGGQMGRDQNIEIGEKPNLIF